MCLYVGTIYLGYPWRPEEGGGSPGVEVTGGCEPLIVGAWNQIWVLYRASSEPLQQLFHLPSSLTINSYTRSCLWSRSMIQKFAFVAFLKDFDYPCERFFPNFESSQIGHVKVFIVWFYSWWVFSKCFLRIGCVLMTEHEWNPSWGTNCCLFKWLILASFCPGFCY